MANDVIRSNLIIGTQVNKPSKDNGFASINASLTNIEKRLDRLVSKPWVIKLELDRSAIDKLDPNAYNKKSPGKGGSGGGAGGGGGGGSRVVRPGGGRPISQTVTTDVKTGIQTGVSSEAQVRGRLLNTYKETEKTEEGLVKTQEKSVDLLNQQKTAAEALAVKQDANTKLARETARAYQAQGYSLSKVSKEFDPLTGKTRRMFEYIKASGDSAENLKVSVARISDKSGKSKEFDVFGSRALKFAPDVANAEKESSTLARLQAANARKARAVERGEYVKEEKEKAAEVRRLQEELDRTIASNAKKARGIERAEYVKEENDKRAAVEKAQAELDRMIAANSKKARAVERANYVKEENEKRAAVEKAQADLDRTIASNAKKARGIERSDYVKEENEKRAAVEKAQAELDRTIASNAKKARAIERADYVKEAKEKAAAAKKIDDDLAKKTASTSRRARLMEVNQYVTDHLNALKKAEKEQQQVEANASKARKVFRDAAVKEQAGMDGEQRRNARAARRQERQEFLAEERAKRVQEGVKAAEGSGFRKFGSTMQMDPMTGRISETTTLAKVSGNALKGYTIEVLKANEATGLVTRQVLTGTQAFKFLGDSISRATVKVGMWALATTAVFAVMQGIKAGAAAMNELESNTVLLARVGRTLVSTGNEEEASFKRRFLAAQQLTTGIIELTTQIGGNAAESQRAAAIFLRTGQTQEEVLTSVKASLIAARIAEIGVEDAAKLLSSALLQFNMKASDLLPTLDSLNSLSNHYRVTTNDLLQSISRTGSVIGEHGGRLTELAAITAVVSQRTAQTGAVIGNAFKTIQSQLDRVDIRKDLFAKLKISTVNFDGSSKSLSETLLELQSRMGALSNAEQKELTVQIAGIRQRNLFVAAINDAHKAIIAENKALFDSESATSEFVDSSKNMEATLSRLSATLIQTTTQTAGPLHALLTDMLEVVNGVLSMTNAMSGSSLGKLAIYAATIVTISTALGALLKYLGLTTVASQLYTTVTYAGIRAGVISTLVNIRQSMSLAGLRAAYALVRTAAMSATVATAAFNIAATVGIVLLISALSAASQAANTYKKSFDTQIETSERFIANENKKQQALHNTTRAIALVISEIDRLNKKGGPDSPQKVGELAQRAGQIARSAGVELAGVNLGTDAGKTEVAKRIAKQQQESAKRELEERAKLIKLKKEQMRQEVLTSSELASQYGQGPSYGSAFTHPFQPGRAAREADQEIEEKHQESIAKSKKLMEEIQELQKQGDPVADLKKLIDEEQKRLALLTSIDKVLLNIEARKGSDQTNAAVRAITGLTTVKAIRADLAAVVADTDMLGDSIRELQQLDAGADNKILDETIKVYNEELDKRIELEKEILKITREQAQQVLAGTLSRRAGFLEKASQIGIQKDRRLGDKSTFGDRLVEIDMSRTNARNRIKENTRLMDQLSTGNSAGDAGRVQALRADTEENLNKLRDLELEKALAILEAEKEIAIERKKSADEAARALGTLSMEDKLRVQAQAKYFAANPNARVSLTDQFLGSENDNKITQQFFEGRADRMKPNSDPLANRLSQAGFGMTNDILEGEKELRAARGGKTDMEIMDNALRNSNRIDRAAGRFGDRQSDANIAQGSELDGAGGQFDASGKFTPKVDVNVNTNLGPLVGSFERATGAIMDAKIQELKDHVDNIVNRKIRPNRPGTAI